MRYPRPISLSRVAGGVEFATLVQDGRPRVRLDPQISWSDFADSARALPVMGLTGLVSTTFICYYSGSTPFGQIVLTIPWPYNRVTLVLFSVRFRAGSRRGVSRPRGESVRFPVMRKRLKIVLMKAPAFAAFLALVLALAPVSAQAGDANIVASREDGRLVFTNEGPATSVARVANASTSAAPGQRQLVYWSNTEHRYKPVPHASL